MNEKRLPRINFRPFLFAACSFALGISLYGSLRFQTFSWSDLVLGGFLLYLALGPFDKKRILCVSLCVVTFIGFGVGCATVSAKCYFSGPESGSYAVSGTVVSLSVHSDYSVAVLSDVSLNGEPVGGKVRVTLPSDGIRTGDRLLFDASVERVSQVKSSYERNYFASDVRYLARTTAYRKVGESFNPFLQLNRAIYNTLHDNMPQDEADVAYALLTGNSGGMDGDLMDAIRKGGIAHVFAVSGLHIGIVYAAVSFCFGKWLKKWKFIPALAVAVCFSALCGFTVSSVRAVLMCAVLGSTRAFGRKSDFLQSIGFAALAVLLFFPAQWYSVGFRLSFGACLGLALFAGTIQRGLSKLPKALSGYLAATLSVQLFTFPVLIESFGYCSVWGTLLNLIVVPVMPIFFLCVLVFTFAAVIIPPLAAGLLLVPSGLISLFLYLFQAVDFSLVLTGFSIGAGVTVWIAGCVFLSERVRMKTVFRAVSALSFALVFTLCVVVQNVVFVGCKIVSTDNAILIRTQTEAVLVLDGEIPLRQCNDFLSRTYGGELTSVVVASENGIAALNRAAFLDANEIRLKEEQETGLRETQVKFGDRFSYGSLQFRYESAHKITVTVQGAVIEIDFEGKESLGGDLFLDGSAELQYFIQDGMIYAIS